jgi:hypothetical protein
MNGDSRPILPVNRNAVISLIAGIFTLLSLCTAVAPIPLTGYVCYPAAVLLGLVALLTGVTSLAQIRATKEDGRTYALIGIWIGGIAIVAAVCATALGFLLFPKIVALLQQYLK